MVLEEETQQKLEISSEKTTRKGKFPFYASEILGNCAFPLSFYRENSNEILIFFAVNESINAFLLKCFNKNIFFRSLASLRCQRNRHHISMRLQWPWQRSSMSSKYEDWPKRMSMCRQYLWHKM